MKIELDMYQTMAVAVLVLMLGKFLKKRVNFLERFCIPAPVIGGVIFAVFTCICYVTGVAEFTFDDILKEVCMVFFFTSVGFQANLKVLRSGGKAMIVFLGLVITLIVFQTTSGSRTFKIAKHKSVSGIVYRLNSNGWRTWYGRSLWPGFGRLWN